MSLAFGVLASTGITLILVPSLYLIVEDLRSLAGLGSAKHTDAEQEAFVTISR